MKIVSVKHISVDLCKKMYWWCHNTFGPGGENEDWLLDNDKFIFWEEDYFSLFLMRWEGQSE